jgi:hypothetical protein
MSESTEERAGLGDLVQDKVSGIVGIVVGRTEYLFGCVRFGVQPQGSTPDGKPKQSFGVDEPQVIVMQKRAIVVSVARPNELRRE